MHRWIPYGALASLCLLGTAPLAFGKPNIIFLLADDQRHDALGCAGNALIQTPTIDRLDRYLAAYPKAPGTSAE